MFCCGLGVLGLCVVCVVWCVCGVWGGGGGVCVWGVCGVCVCVCVWCMCGVCVCADGSLMPVISSLGGGTVMRGDGSFSLPGGRGAGVGRQCLLVGLEQGGERGAG